MKTFTGSTTSETVSKSYVYTLSLIAAIGGFLFGFDTGVISGAIEFIRVHFSLNAHQEGFTVSNILIGCIFGAMFAGVLSDRLGRKKILMFTAFIFALSAVLSGIPRTLPELVGARFIGGLAVGMASIVSPMYIAEIAPAGIRGRLVAINQLAIVTGILGAYFVDWLLVDIGANNWRWMFVSETLPAFALLIGMFFVPESPRWLTKQGRIRDALSILTRIGGSKHADAEIKQIQTTIEQEKGTLKQLFHKGLRYPLVIGIFLAIFQQVTGINTVIYYAPKIFLNAGYESENTAFLASVIVGMTNFLATIISLWIIDKLGRKPLLLIGTAGMGISFAVAGIAFHAKIGGLWILFPILSYVLFFAIGLGPVVWVLLSEIFPTKIRGRAMSIATMILWISCFAVSQTFPWLVENIKDGTFYMYAGMCFVTFIFVRKWVVETKGRTLEEIETFWKV